MNIIKNIFYRSWPYNKLKTVELQIFWWFKPAVSFDFWFNLFRNEFSITLGLLGLFKFSVSYDTKSDHCGFRFALTLIFISLEFNFTDNRHWDHENNRWEEYK